MKIWKPRVFPGIVVSIKDSDIHTHSKWDPYIIGYGQRGIGGNFIRGKRSASGNIKAFKEEPVVELLGHFIS